MSCSQVDGELWDLDRPLEKDCSLQLLKFDDEEGMAPLLDPGLFCVCGVIATNTWFWSYLSKDNSERTPLQDAFYVIMYHTNGTLSRSIQCEHQKLPL